jgi:hypothetical protein
MERCEEWVRSLKLLDDGVLTKEQLKPLKGYFFELLKLDEKYISKYSWSIAPDLMDRRVITQDELIQLKDGFLELLLSKDDELREGLFEIAERLTNKGIIRNEELKSMHRKAVKHKKNSSSIPLKRG